MNKKLVGIGLVAACIVLFGSCKPKQSAYKSVYEAAKEREMESSSANTSSIPASSITPSYTPSSNETVKKEKIRPVYDSDAAGLRAYNVVIAAMGMKPNAESLKQRMENEGYKIILVQNEAGMYRVIIASYDSKDEAVAKKNEILTRFANLGDAATLKNKYGIPFNDWWILQRDY